METIKYQDEETLIILDCESDSDVGIQKGKSTPVWHYLTLFVCATVFAVLGHQTGIRYPFTKLMQVEVNTELGMGQTKLSVQRAILRELNEVRQDPQSLIPYLQAMIPKFNGNTYEEPGETPMMTQEGSAVVNELITELQNTAPIGPLELEVIMSDAAQIHVDDMKDGTGHTGTDGSSPGDRVNRFGQWETTVGENISYGKEDPKEIVAQLMIDDGVANRGHRKNILNPAFHVVGIATGPHSTYDHQCVMVLAGGFTPKAGYTAQSIHGGSSSANSVGAKGATCAAAAMGAWYALEHIL